MTEDQPLTAYPFPIQMSDSLVFTARGAFIEKAVLSSGIMPLSIVKPKYKSHILKSGDVPPDTELAFFGDKPFHCGLAFNWNVKITLYTTGGTPTLIFIPRGKALSWKDIPKGVLYDAVVAGSDSGEVTKTLVYTSERGGYSRS